jgi:hypothetical protein
MAIKKKTDWTETLLYVFIAIIFLIFLYQLLKLVNAGNNFFSSIPQALANSVAAVESGLASLITSPLSFLTGFLGSIPALLSYIFGGFLSLLTGQWELSTIFGGITGGLSSIFGSATPVNTSTGSSTPAVLTPTTSPASSGTFVATPNADGSTSYNFAAGQPGQISVPGGEAFAVPGSNDEFLQ